jgi:hypothetical protein
LAFKLSQACQLFLLSLRFPISNNMALVLGVLACKLGHKWLRPCNIKALSIATMGFINNKLPSRQGNSNNDKKATIQELPELATLPVLLNNMDAAPVVVSTASCCTL